MRSIPGVSVREPVTDVVGRTGIALSYTAGGSATELVFDPVTYQYLGVNRKLAVFARDPGREQITLRMPAQEALLRVSIVDGMGDQ